MVVMNNLDEQMNTNIKCCAFEERRIVFDSILGCHTRFISVFLLYGIFIIPAFFTHGFGIWTERIVCSIFLKLKKKMLFGHDLKF